MVMTPISYFNDVWQRCEEIEAIHTYISGKLTAVLSKDELLRAEWMSRVSALDLYVHELVAQNMLKIFEGVRPHCPGFVRFNFSSETLIRIHNASTQADASAAFDLEIRNKLSRITYQFPDDIADGVRLFSDCELWNEVALKLGATPATKISNAKAIKKSLSLIIERRNKIAHEGDLQPTIPRTPWPISRDDVTYVSRLITDIVSAMDSIV
jgi:hypothetical protein